MAKASEEIVQVWECPHCGSRLRCPRPIKAATCASKHPDPKTKHSVRVELVKVYDKEEGR